MPTVTYGVSMSAGGINIQKTGSRTGEGLIGKEVTLPAGKPVTNWVKTDADTAGCDLPGGHGYTNGNFDVFWDGGRRYGVPGTISTNALTLDGGAGTDFPASGNLTVVVCRQVEINVAIDGDALQVLGLSFEFTSPSITDDGHATFKDAAADVIAEIDLEANTPQIYDVAGGQANPFTGDPITKCFASNGCSTSGATLKICGVDDSTP
jgi:hypothetical protein